MVFPLFYATIPGHASPLSPQLADRIHLEREIEREKRNGNNQINGLATRKSGTKRCRDDGPGIIRIKWFHVFNRRPPIAGYAANVWQPGWSVCGIETLPWH